ncbi:AAA family ATPase [Echinicola vietnamensis]|uniref:Putative ATPase n=1 Tax=Echinicola vietnamensis (strain DSM 17526 / LMG 23754 / KMM 6221) TaxID=926556 RepID=L0G1Z3_ECHVK|nr:AAA family ATPase [Echinicola vietnamensis]AGA80244.1 putative ATPase [Echinicola vietnamensis DSM 17526]
MELNQNFLTSLKLYFGHKKGYPYDIPSLSNVKELSFECPVTFFVGENGSGKSTLLEAIAVGMGLNAEGGSKNFNFSTHESHSTLSEDITFIKGYRKPKDSFFLRAESFYNVASEIDRLGGDIHQQYGNRSLHSRSHGESFLALMENRFRGNGFYLFDEIESALSPSRQLDALAQMDRLVKQKSQVIMATHSPILLAYPNACIFEFSHQGIKMVPYEETETYRVTKDFLMNYKHIQHVLFNG